MCMHKPMCLHKPGSSYGKPSYSKSNLAPQEIDLAELFSGSANLSKEFYYEGKEVAACDYKYGRGMDICKSSGFGSLDFIFLGNSISRDQGITSTCS